MLDEEERRRLSEIDAHLQASDPRLAQKLSNRRVGSYPRWIAVSAALVLAVVATTLGGLLAGPPGAIAGTLVAIAVACGFWLQSRHTRPGRPANGT